MNFFDVTDYGAIPDDENDDYTAIEAAIGAAKNTIGLSIVYFPSGTYKVFSPITLEVEEYNGTVTFDGNIVFQGDGTSSILDFDLPYNGNTPFSFIGLRKSYINIDNNIQKGDTSISANGLVDLVNNNDWIHIREYDSPKTTDSHHVIGQITQIVNENSGLIKDEASKNYSKDNDLRVYKIIPIINVAIEKLKIIRKDTGHSYNRSNIRFYIAVNCWVKGEVHFIIHVNIILKLNIHRILKLVAVFLTIPDIMETVDMGMVLI